MMRSMQQKIQQVLRPGVQKKELMAWAMYDFANSGYTTVVLTTVFNAYFVSTVAGAYSWGTLALTVALSLSYLLIMLSMPSLGAYADAKQAKRKLLFLSTGACIVGTLFLSRSFVGDVWWALGFIVLSNYFYCMGESLISSFLPELAQPDALGRVSGWGWGFGYFGGMLALGLSLVIVLQAEAAGYSAERYVSWVLVLTAALFFIATLPAFFFLRERVQATRTQRLALFQQLRFNWRECSEHFPELRKLLLCGACYHAGIAVVVTLSAVYATEAMQFTMLQTIMLIFTVNIAAAVGALLFGHVQDRAGHKLALMCTLIGWCVMVVLAATAYSHWQFWLSAVLAGLCIGSSQSAGRAMVGALAPQHRLGEFYGLWTLAVQFAAMVGPLCYGLTVWLSHNNHRLAIWCTLLFFVAGIVVLLRINFDKAKQQRDALHARPVSTY